MQGCDDPTSSLDSKERMAPVDIRGHVYLHMYTCMCICEYDLTYYVLVISLTLRIPEIPCCYP